MKPVDNPWTDRIVYVGLATGILVSGVIIVREPADLVLMVWVILVVVGSAEAMQRLMYWVTGKIRWHEAVPRAVAGAAITAWGVLELTEVITMGLRFVVMATYVVAMTIHVRCQWSAAGN